MTVSARGNLWQSPLFTTCSRAVSRCIGAAMFCLAWVSSAVLYRVVSRFLAGLVERKCYSHNRKTRSYHSSRQLFIQGHGSGYLSTGYWSVWRELTPGDPLWPWRQSARHVKLTDLGSIPLQFFFLFKGYDLWTLSFNPFKATCLIFRMRCNLASIVCNWEMLCSQPV